MTCNCDRLIVELKQGESRSLGFTIKNKEEPMDLTDYIVIVEVKNGPYFKLPNLIEKTISIEVNEDGHIYDPNNGKFKIDFTQEDTTKLPPRDYSLIVYLVNGDTKIIISGEGNSSGVLRFCKC